MPPLQGSEAKPYCSETEQASLPHRRTRKSREARRTELLNCAVEAFAEKGLGRAGHNDVATLAHVSVPTVFDYFPTRTVLINAVLKHVVEFWQSISVNPEEDYGADPHLALYRICRRCTEAVVTHEAYVKIWLDWGTAIHKEFWDDYLAFNERVVSAFEDRIDRGKHDGYVSRSIDSNTAARLIVGQAQMILTLMLSGFDRDKLDAFIHHYVNAALDFEAAG